MMRKILLTCLFITYGLMLYAQQRTISGKVTDAESNEGIPSASVSLKGTNEGTVTDNIGNFKLEVPEKGTLVISFIGMETQEVKLDSRSVYNVAMNYNVAELGEVLVIGYGTTTVKDATGAITSVDEKSFNKGNIVTPENLLSGRVAGVNVSTGGAPGSGSEIRIRGGSSLDASNAPLIVINGLPIDNDAVGGGRSALSSINPNNIKSFTVLKDASATAIYGSRAANGVILITTKEGGKELKVNVDLQAGIGELPNTIDVFSANEYRQLINDRLPERVDELGNANTNWQDEIYQTSRMYNANVAVQGSLFKKIPTRFSVGRSDQEGIRLTSEFVRNSGSLNLTPSFFDDNLKVSINANGSIEKNRFAGGQEGNALLFDPTQPVYDRESPFGVFFQYYELDENDDVLNAGDLIGLAPLNPVAELLQRKDISTVNRFYGNAKLDYKLHFFPSITASANIGLDQQEGEGSTRVSNQNPLTQLDGSIIGSYTTYTSSRKNSLLDLYLDYNERLDRLKLNATAGYSYQRFQNQGYFSGETLVDTEDTEPVTNIATDQVLIGLFARTNFNWDNRYILTLSYRRDGTSRFINENRWGNFPAAAFAWQIKEDVLPNFAALSSLKLRLGWGITGQQSLPAGNEDLYLEKYRTGLPASQYRFGNQTYRVGVPQFRNEDLKWEETTTYNIGIDYGLFNERISGAVEVFYKDTKDLFVNAAISDGSNFSNAGLQNLGDLTSKGLEFTINSFILESDNDGFNWDVNFNATFIDREISRIALDQDRLTGAIAGGTGGTIQIYRTGFDPLSFFVYNQVYDQNGNPIEGAYADLNGDNQINENDRYIYKNGSPDVTMGFLSNMSYKGLDFSFNLRASVGNQLYNNINSARAQYNQLTVTPVLTNLPTAVRKSDFEIAENVILSDYFIEDASFLRMDNITLGYTIQEILNSKLSVRFSAGVQNAFVITNYSGLDPEINGGIDNTIYPRARTYYLGANINF